MLIDNSEPLVLNFKRFTEIGDWIPENLAELRNDNPTLFFMIHGRARGEAAQHLKEWAISRSDSEKGKILNERVAETMIEAQILSVIESLKDQVRQRKREEEQWMFILQQYPLLRRILKLSVHEARLREDGHHMVIKGQRKIATLMLKLAQKRKDFFDSPWQIFDLSADELIAFIREENPDYLRKTFERREIEVEVDQFLTEQSMGDKSIVEFLKQQLARAIDILQWQKSQSKIARTQLYYQGQIERLTNRMKSFSSPTQDIGGIDLNQIEVKRPSSSGLNTQPGSEMSQPFLDSKIDNFTPAIIRLMPINNLESFLNLS